MNEERMYLDFRKELDEYAIPLIIENAEYIELIEDNKQVGFACIMEDYIDAFYILPEYRKKGIGSKLVKQLVKENNLKRLHIINSNIPALNFWKKNFELRKLEINFCDTLYEILKEKNNES